MDTHSQSQPQPMPLSPSLSIESTANWIELPTAFDDGQKTQSHFSYTTPLLNRGIDPDDLIARYNRCSIPLMKDKMFCHLVERIAAENAPEELEPALGRSLAQESDQLSKAYQTAMYTVGLGDVDAFQSNLQRFRFRTGVCSLTVHGFEALVAYCLPDLFEACQKKSKPRQRNPKRQPKNNRNAASKVSKPSSQQRENASRPRSVPTSQITPRRSMRIQKKLSVSEDTTIPFSLVLTTARCLDPDNDDPILLPARPFSNQQRIELL